jgi:succinyl-diaminopimelate desuccinylase
MNSLDYEVDLLSKMVEINTDSISKNGYNDCASLIIQEAEKNSLDWFVVDGEKGAKDGLSRPNVIVSLDSNSETTLLIESHFDIVPPGNGWKNEPFKLTIVNGKAYGRGAADNKSGIAAALGAFNQLGKEKLEINLVLIAGVDEEIGGRYGIDYVMSDFGLKGDAALVVDAGPENLFLGASGIIWGKATVKGKQGHAGYPFKARNAIDETMKLISEFEKYKNQVEKKESSLRSPIGSPKDYVWGRYSVTMINGGEKENVIPGVCEFRFDRRLLPEESLESAEKELKDFFDEIVKITGCEASLELVNKQSGYHTSEDNIFVQTVSEVINQTLNKDLPLAAELGGNDGTFFAKNNIPVVCFGPIRADTNYHGLNEFVYLKDMKNTRDLIINLGKVKKEKICDYKT